MKLSLDSELRRKPVYLKNTLRHFGFVDDVIIDPKFGVTAIVSHHSHWGTWAFPYIHAAITADGIAVTEYDKASPRKFMNIGSSYQEFLGAKVLGPDGSILGHVKDIELMNPQTGEIAYRVSPSGMRGLWSPPFSVNAATQVGAVRHDAIVLRASRTDQVSTSAVVKQRRDLTEVARNSGG
jgi:sporulation protein YlmC with PRC-barrel domain